jgi:hypothetical protein
LNIFRRHRAGCSKADTRPQDCPSKPKCPIHFEGVDGVGIRRKRQALVDPATGGGVRDWNRAVEIIREFPNAGSDHCKAAGQLGECNSLVPCVQVTPESRCSTEIEIGNRQAQVFPGTPEEVCRGGNIHGLGDFRAQWTDSSTTQRRNQEVMRGFFAFCVKSDFIVKNPAVGLDPIREGRPKTEPFTREEMERIFSAISFLTDEYGRQGQPIAAQTRAFVMVMRYSGMSIGDTAKLRKADVDGCRIRTYRKKTGEDVFAKVPPFVIEALGTAPHDSEEFYFWTGQGKLHTRTSKWGNRLQRLFVVANVRMVETEKRKGLAES